MANGGGRRAASSRTQASRYRETLSVTVASRSRVGVARVVEAHAKAAILATLSRPRGPRRGMTGSGERIEHGLSENSRHHENASPPKCALAEGRIRAYLAPWRKAAAFVKCERAPSARREAARKAAAPAETPLAERIRA